MAITYGLLGAAYVAVFYHAWTHWSLVQLPITPWSVALCVVLADFAYYCEHRFTHRVGIGWATHTVHHSSPYFNISVAYRFGPLDGVFPILFHLPLVLMGFNPTSCSSPRPRCSSTRRCSTPRPSASCRGRSRP